jgi:glycosyltransferase involved in cell wall biosynthesis
MIIVIVPSHNQAQHIENIIKGYERQTVKPDVVLFVFDRCSDNSIETIKNISTNITVKYIEKTEGNNFSAGMTRDFGVDYFNTDYKMIVFTDGDCVPGPKVIEEHLQNIRRTKKAIVSCGKRYCQQEDLTWKDDERNIGEWVNGFGFEKNGRVVLSKHLTLDNILTYSCNLAFNKKAIELCKNINSKLSNSNRVFNPNFDGSWGGEDNFISNCLFLTNNWITLTSNHCCVYHHYHKEQTKDVTHKRNIVNNLSSQLEEKIRNNEIEGKITHIEKTYDTLDCYSNIHIALENYGEMLDEDLKNILKQLPNKDPYFQAIASIQYSRMFELIGNCGKRIQTNIGKYDYYKTLLNYSKFYLENDQLSFYDDWDKFSYKVLNKGYSYK